MLTKRLATPTHYAFKMLLSIAVARRPEQARHVGLRLFTFALILVATPSQGYGQSVDLPEASSSTSANLVSDRAFRWVDIHTTLRYEADGSGTREFRMSVRINSPEGARYYSQISYVYPLNSETIEFSNIRIMKSDSTIWQSAVESVEQVRSRADDMHGDRNRGEARLRINHLEVGDLLEFSAIYHVIRPPIRGEFWFRYDFHPRSITDHEVLEINVPNSKPVAIKVTGPVPSPRLEEGRKVYRWIRNSADLSEVDASSVQITTFNSWDAVGKWYAQLQAAKGSVTARIKTKSNELMRGLGNDDEKIESSYHYVASLAYTDTALRESGFEPRSAEEVLLSGYGDCKDKQVLLTALLAAANIKVWPALINSSTTDVDQGIAYPGQFDHVISAVKTKHGIVWLDTTAGVIPFGFLTVNLRAKPALVIASSPGTNTISVSFQETPAQPPFGAARTFFARGSIDSYGSYIGVVQQTARGDAEIMLRTAYLDTPREGWEQLTQRVADGNGFTGTIEKAIIGDPLATEMPFQFSYTYKKSPLGDWQNRRIVAPLPWFGLESYAVTSMPADTGLFLGALGDFIYSSQTSLPAGLASVYADQVDWVADFAEYHAIYKISGGILTANRRLTVKRSQVFPADWPRFLQLCRLLSAERDRYIDLK